MEPITREEYYLAKIAGTYEGKTPKPVTIEEYYLATMAGDYSGNTPQPVTRLQYYMAKAAGVWGGSIPAPVTRLEYYWAAIANGEGEVFPPVTREEHFLALVADAYSVVLTVVTGNPALLEGVKGSRFTSLALHGKSSQGSTTGAQLLDMSEAELRGYNIYNIKAAIKAGQTYTFTNGANAKNNVKILGIKGDGAEFSLSATYLSPGKSETFTAEFDTSLVLLGGIDSKTNLDGKYMLNAGSKALPYEPYTGGAPSPSPSYPQEIESAGQSGEIGIEVCGGNLLQPVNGNIGEYINISDGVITINSGAEGRRNFMQIPETIFNPGKYTMSVVPLDNIINDGTLEIAFGIQETPEIYSDGKLRAEWYFGGSAQLGNGVTTNEVTNKITAKYLNVDIVKGNFTGQRFKLVLNIGSTALPYEPYKPAQKLVIPTPGGLPGIPVSSGGNYTDEKGQQWVADEIDLAKGEKVQWIGKTVVDGGEMKFVDYPDSNFWDLPHKTSPGIIKGTPCTSRYFAEGIFRVNSLYDFIFTTPKKMKPYFDTPEELNAFCVQKNSEGNPLTIYYCMDTPIRTPLPPETIAAYKKLHTYSPTTTVINDAGAGMSVGYAKMK